MKLWIWSTIARLARGIHNAAGKVAEHAHERATAANLEDISQRLMRRS